MIIILLRYFYAFCLNIAHVILRNNVKRKKMGEINVFIPRWKYLNNVGGILRTCTILGHDLYIGVDTIMSKTGKKALRHFSCGFGDIYDIVSIFDQMKKFEKKGTIYVFDTPTYWKINNIKEKSIFDISSQKLQEDITLVFGHELDGTNLTYLKNCKYIAVSIPQDESVISSRKKEINNISFNMAHATVFTLGIINTIRRM